MWGAKLRYSSRVVITLNLSGIPLSLLNSFIDSKLLLDSSRILVYGNLKRKKKQIHNPYPKFYH